MMDLITARFSQGLEDEIEWKLGIEHEDEFDRFAAILELCEDCEDDDCPAYEFRRELRALMVGIGAYREVTTEQLVNICTVAGGRTRASSPDFRMNRKMYLFDSWQPMHDAIEAARKAVS